MHWWPLLFSLFINCLPPEIDSNWFTYADDVRIYCNITAPADGLLLQRDLDHFQSWAVRWGLILIPPKYHSFTTTRGRAPVREQYSIWGTVLSHEDTTRDLGAMLDNKLVFADHISHVVKQANRSLGSLIRSFRNANKLLNLATSIFMEYHAKVSSHLEYCTTI